MSAVKQVAVAAAVLLRPDGQFLLGQRAPDTFYPGYWEFPGGKVEPGETPAEALVRELSEELGIRVLAYRPWIVREHHYEHAHVRLHFFIVTAWEGELHDHVHSALSWQPRHSPAVAPMLPANAPVLKALQLPECMRVTQAHVHGEQAELAALADSLARGVRLVQVREQALPLPRREAFVCQVLAQVHAVGGLVVVNLDPAQPELPAELLAQVDGIQVSARVMAGLSTRPAGFAWVGASCHSAQELLTAEALGCDYAVLGTVLPTPSHPAGPVLGWDGLAALVSGRSLPVLAIGGLGLADLARVQACGAHGVAGIRGM